MTMMPGIILGGIALLLSLRTRHDLALASRPRVLFEIAAEPGEGHWTEGSLLLRTRNDVGFRVTNIRVLSPRNVFIAGTQDEVSQSEPDWSAQSAEKDVDWVVSIGSINQHRDVFPKKVRLFFGSKKQGRSDVVIELRLTYEELTARRRKRHIDLLSNPASISGTPG
jgi:hypothetical protein